MLSPKYWWDSDTVESTTKSRSTTYCRCEDRRVLFSTKYWRVSGAGDVRLAACDIHKNEVVESIKTLVHVVLFAMNLGPGRARQASLNVNSRTSANTNRRRGHPVKKRIMQGLDAPYLLSIIGRAEPLLFLFRFVFDP